MTLLIGDATTTYSVSDNITAGSDIQAWAFTASATGTVDTLMFRTAAQADAGITGLVLGIYADSTGSPGVEPTTSSPAIGQGTFSGRPAANTWINVTGLSIAVVNGTRYWLAAIPLGTGNVYYNDAVASGGTNVDDSSTGGQTSLTTVTAWSGPFGVGPMGFQGIASGPPPPVVTSISPSSGSTSGGTTVTIGGSGLTGATAVHFGGNLATNITVVSDTIITCISPAGFAGTVDITVTTSNGTSSTSSADHFLYQTPTTNIGLTSYIGTQTPIGINATHVVLYMSNVIPPNNITPPVITPAAPLNVIAPTVSGTATHGDTLTAISGTWYNMDDVTWAPAYSFQWQTSPNGTSSWGNLGGATSMTYVVQVSDETNYLRVGVTASNTGSGGGGVTTVDSAATSQVN